MAVIERYEPEEFAVTDDLDAPYDPVDELLAWRERIGVTFDTE